MEFLFLRNQGDVAEHAVTPLLVQCCQDTVIVRFRVAEPLACQHFLNTMTESNQVSLRPPPALAAPCGSLPQHPWGLPRTIGVGFWTPCFLSLHHALAPLF